MRRAIEKRNRKAFYFFQKKHNREGYDECDKRGYTDVGDDGRPRVDGRKGEE